MTPVDQPAALALVGGAVRDEPATRREFLRLTGRTSNDS